MAVELNWIMFEHSLNMCVANFDGQIFLTALLPSCTSIRYDRIEEFNFRTEFKDRNLYCIKGALALF